jgi:hypothetical protein
MIISHRHRFIYLKCRKVGSTSLEVALADLCGPDDVVTPLDGVRTRADPDRRINWQNHVLPRERWPLAARLKVACGMTTRRAGVEFYNHIRADRLRRMVDPAVFDGYFKFAVERNPWDREVSNYFFQHPRADDRPPFAEFVRTHTARWPIDNFDIYTIGGRIVVDRVLRHESLEADFQAVMDRLGIADAPSLGRARARHRPEKGTWRHWYDADTRDLVGRLYAREIAAFGYTF